MQLAVPMWEAAGFLGMSEKTLRDTYGHHHPDHLKGASTAMGTHKPQSLVISLVEERMKRQTVAKMPENVGGGRSRCRTRLCIAIPC
jgi:hypothetical protein